MARMKPNDSIQTMMQIMPVIYAASIPHDIRWNDGWLKIGEARKQFAIDRLSQEGHEIDSDLRIEWEQNALFEGNPIAFFRDKDFHKYLKKKGVEVAKRRATGNDMEVFKIDKDTARNMLYEFRNNRGLAKIDGIEVYTLRKEQQEAVDMAYNYAKSHMQGEFLWNCKPRFGKTLAAYDLAKRLKAKNVLIVTNRPAIANSWYDDYAKFIGRGEEGYFFVSNTDALKNKKWVISYSEYESDIKSREEKNEYVFGMIYFLSLQDLKGSMYFGGDYDKLREISVINWDMLCIDEAHEGIDTYKTDKAFDHIRRNFTLHLSGTPFKALSNEKFKSDAIYNWTYADEQKRKSELTGSLDNPYATLPKLNMFTYQMSEVCIDKVTQGINIDGQTEEYFFDLNEFFRVKEGTTSFIHGDLVDNFLNSLTAKEKYPFSTNKLRDELKHTLWLLDRVDSAKALAKKLVNHPVFKDYEIVLAAGNGKVEEDDSTLLKSFDKVVKAIKENDKTITLSVGQLTTGITIPEWTAVLMLSNINSPALYMQAAFRAQNPCTLISRDRGANGEPIFKSKENAYVFDFDPARTLTVFEKFANNLNPITSNGGGTLEQRQQNIRELLNFFPVIGEDENGELVELNVEQVLTIPRKIRSQEVVRRGFMSNFLFNISNVFKIPTQAIDIINKFEPAKEQKGSNRTDIIIQSGSGFNVDDEGNVSSTDENINDVKDRLFGNKKYQSIKPEEIDNAIADVSGNADKDNTEKLANQLESMLTSTAKTILNEAQNQYGTNMKKSDVNQISSRLKATAAKRAHDLAADYKIKQNTLQKGHEETKQQALDNINREGKSSQEIEAEMEKISNKIDTEFEKKHEDAKAEMKQKIADIIDNFEEESKNTTVKTVEEKNEQRRANNILNDIKDRLRGFSRTIPSFIMAYSNDENGNPTNITLKTFDQIVPDDVFQEVTSITLEQFRQLRDGFDYTDENGNQQHFDGNVFDTVVFNDSINEFVNWKDRLANYFNENSYIIQDGHKYEDIFDIIPPQKTNQIYTPKAVVKQMVDYLEQENPGCFNNPDTTFIDLYMKSGLFITEIVKRLYRSPKIIALYPDGNERLKHIFDKQVYGLAPTKIIYAIATNYILGFAKTRNLYISTDHFKELDALPYAQGLKDMSLEEKLTELFG